MCGFAGRGQARAFLKNRAPNGAMGIILAGIVSVPPSTPLKPKSHLHSTIGYLLLPSDSRIPSNNVNLMSVTACFLNLFSLTSLLGAIYRVGPMFPGAFYRPSTIGVEPPLQGNVGFNRPS